MTLAVEQPAGEPEERSVTVVGTGRAFDVQGATYLQQPDLVSVAEPTEAESASGSFVTRQWLVDRPQPLIWAEIEELNTHGVLAYSRHVALHPETAARQVEQSEQDEVALLVVAAASLGLFLLTTLLAGPAFAVSAARQRRTLALAASNGATSAQLRRSVLGQALVLGVFSSLIGTGLGVAGGIAATWAIRRVRPDLMFGPLDIPWPAVGLVAGAAVVSSVVAALIPSRGLGTLDIVSVLRGQSVSPRLRRRVPTTGAILTAVGAAAVTWTSFGRTPMLYLVFLAGCVLMVVGSLMLVPLALATVARFAHRLPLPARMAAREAGRQRGRATPTVAAIMAGAAVLAVVAIGLQADTVRRARDHQEIALPGQGMVQGAFSAPNASVAESLTRADPTVSTVTLQRLSDSDITTPTTLLAAQRTGCTLRETVTPIDYRPELAPDTRCLTLATDSPLTGTSLTAAPLEELERFLDLDAAQRDALARGAVAIVDPAAVADLPRQSLYAGIPQTIDRHRPVDVDVHDGMVTFASYPEKRDNQDMPVVPSEEDITTVDVPVVRLSHEQWSRLVSGWYSGPGGLVTTETATRLGATPQMHSILVRAPGGISPELESRLNDLIGATQADMTLQVERGYQRDDALALAIAFGVIGLLILVATLIATALSQAENAPLLGTLAAVGATRATRRALAGAQALYLGLLGSVIGVAVGLVPGVALGRLITTTYREDGTPVFPESIDIPWLQVVIPLLAVPLVAGALAWVSIRRAPSVTRRAT
jgi:putative ABC transport system permease protein